MSATRPAGRTRRVVWAALATLVAAAGTGASAQEASPHVQRLVSELRERQASLERRERELAERERAIVELEARVDDRLAELAEIQRTVEARIQAWEGQDGDRIKRLARVYGEMPPERAAPLLENLSLDLATSIVSRMKAKDSAKVLAVMDADQALYLSRRVARPLEPGVEASSR
jgi:flagellar motility protein MotE (MotC chaperone)